LTEYADVFTGNEAHFSKNIEKWAFCIILK